MEFILGQADDPTHLDPAMAHAPALPGGGPQTVEGWDWEKRMEKLSWWSLGPLGPSVCSLVTPSPTSWNLWGWGECISGIHCYPRSHT